MDENLTIVFLNSSDRCHHQVLEPIIVKTIYSSSSAPTEPPNAIIVIAHIPLIDSSSSTTSLCEPMNECYHYLLLLSLFSSLGKIISTNLPNVTIQHVCEHDLLSIKCSNKYETIQIVRSMYGRTSQRICNVDMSNQIYTKTCANIEQSKYETKLRCHGKSNCEILIDNTIFNDPCGLTIGKHFEIHYRCINTVEICLPSFQNCSKAKDLRCIEKIQDEYSCQCPSNICEYNDKNQIIGFIEMTCPEEFIQGIKWSKTLVNKGQHMSCPYPCTGQIFRFCHMNGLWSKPNYTDCQCPIKRFGQFSMHHLAHSYVFQCNFWLINRLLPKDNQCIFETDDNDDGSSTCLLSAFEKMSSSTCLSFSIDFKNLGFQIFLPKKSQSQFRLPIIDYNILSNFGLNQIIVHRIDHSYENLPMMFIDRKNATMKSIILIEQSHNISSIQTANVTIIFNHRSTDLRYQCRAYRSRNSSFKFDSSDMFFACQLLCSNGTHIICQCPFYNPFMNYVLHVDTSIHPDDFQLSMIDNDLRDRCSIGLFNKTMEQSINKIDYYINKFSLYNQKTNLAKKLFRYIDSLIDNDNQWLNDNYSLQWNRFVSFIQQIEFLASELRYLSYSFNSIYNHLEIFINTQEFENQDRSIIILNAKEINLSFCIISKFDEYLNRNRTNDLLNSRIVHINSKQKYEKNIEIVFEHINKFNHSNQISTCVYLKRTVDDFNRIHWDTDGCYLLSSNSTHSTCSCNHISTFAVLLNFEMLTIKSNIYQLSFITQIGCFVGIICLLLTIIILTIRCRKEKGDDLMTVRNILHMNMSICLLITQFLFIFGIDQDKNEFGCQITIILLHYFLLSTFSWMFVDGIELIIALNHVFKIDRIRILAYALYAYGFPLLIVILSLSLANNGHVLKKNCWFPYDNTFIWGFAIPFVLLILGNICFFIVSIYTICKHLNTPHASQEIRYSLRDVTTLSILFGLTWLIGLFYLHEQNSILFAYAFTILNSFQCLLIFIFDCVLHKTIRHKYLQRIFNFHKTSAKQDKSNQHYNTSSSGYCSGHSSDTNKQILSFDHQSSSSFCTSPEYLTSMPIGLLTTFRYPTSNLTLPIVSEHNEQLLKRYKIEFNHSQDDHQYYEIG